MASIASVTTTEVAASVEKLAKEKIKGPKKRLAEGLAEERRVETSRTRAPIAISGNNVYITWWSNKTGNDEVMFRHQQTMVLLLEIRST
jgi:hypothetical protein